MKISGVAEGEDRERDVREWEKEYSDILTKEPGLTNLTEFRMDTGNHPPFVCAPQTLMTSVNNELDWLLEKGYIRESTSSWASPAQA